MGEGESGLEGSPSRKVASRLVNEGRISAVEALNPN